MPETPTTVVDFVLGPDTERKLMDSVTDAFTKALDRVVPILDKSMMNMGKRMAADTAKGMAAGMGPINNIAADINNSFKNLGKRIAGGWKPLQDAAENIAHEFDHTRVVANTFLSDTGRSVLALTAIMKEMGDTMQMQNSAIRHETEMGRRASIDVTARQSDANRLQVEEIRAKSRESFAASQKEEIFAKIAANAQIEASKEASRKTLLDTRISAQRRRIIHQQLFSTIRSLEKATSRVISETYKAASKAASAAVSGIGKLGGGIAHILSRERSGVDTEMKRLTGDVSTNSKRMNTEFTQGLNSTLNRRESILRSSFRTQETIISKSVIRQQAAMTKMRAVTSTGVTGAITGRGLGMGIGSLIGGVGLAAWLKGGFTEAVNLNEQLNKTRVVFGDSADAAIAFSANAVNSLGSTRAEALTATATFGNLFRAIGLNEGQSEKMSTSLVQLAADLSSFNNVPIEDAFEAIRSGLVGEQEPLRKFGVNLNDVTLKAKAMELGLFDGKGTLGANAKAQAAYALILEQTSLAQGDFARTADVGANAQRRASKAAKELAASIAGKLMPAANVVFGGMITLFTGMSSALNDSTNPALHEMKRALMGAAVAMGAVIAMKGIIEVFKLLGAALKLALTPLGAILVAAGLLGAGISILMERSKSLRDTIGVLGGKFVEIGKKIRDFALPIFAAIGKFIDDTVIPAIDRLATWLADHLVGAFDATVRFVTDKVFPVFAAIGRFVMATVVPAFQAVIRFITDRVIPALANAAGFIAKYAKAGWDIAFRFVREKVIPGFKAFIGFLTDTVYPILVNVGRWFQDAFGVAADKVQQFWDHVRPVLQPIIDGFKTLGRAIGAVFTGDFSQIGSGFKAVGSGFAAAFGNIADIVGKLLSDAWDGIKAWMKRIFTLPNLIEAGKAVLDFVEWIGKTIGTVISHPAFIAALVAIAAAAALVAARFIEGVAKGLWKNIPTLIKLVAAGFVFGLIAAMKLAFENPAIVAAILLGLGLLFKAKALIGVFAAAGKASGGGFVGGLKGGMKTIGGGAKGGFGFLSSLFGGSPGTAVKSYFKDLNKQTRLEVAQVQTRLRVLGSSFKVDDQNLKNAKKELRELSKGVSNARMHGLLLRDAYIQGGKAIGGFASGVGHAISGIAKSVGSTLHNAFFPALNNSEIYRLPASQGGKKFVDTFANTMKANRKQIGDGFAFAMTSLKTLAEGQGTTVGRMVGKALGKALAKGAIGAAAIAGGFVAGKAEGSAGGSGIISALLGGVTAGAVIGGGFGAAVGVLTAGAGLIGAAFGRAEKKAKEFKEEIERLSKVFRDDLVEAIESGALTLDGLKNMSFGDVLALGDNMEQTVTAIADKLTPAQLSVIRQSGLTILDVVDMLTSAGGDLETFGDQFEDVFLGMETATADWKKHFTAEQTPAIMDVLKRILAPRGPGSVKQWLEDNIHDVDPWIGKLVMGNKDFLEAIIGTTNGVRSETDAIAAAIKVAEDWAAVTAKPPPSKLPGIRLVSFEMGIAEGFDWAQLAKDVLAAEFATEDYWKILVKSGDSAEVATKKLERMGLPISPRLQGQIEDWNAALDTTAVTAEKINTAMEAMPSLFGAAIAAAAGIEPTQTIDEAIVNSASISASVTEAVTKGLDTTLGRAEFNQSIRSISDIIGAVIADGVRNGTIIDDATARAVVAPLHDAMIEALGIRPEDPDAAKAWDEAKAQIDKVFSTGVTGLQPFIDQENIAIQAKTFNDGVQQWLTDHPLVLGAEAQWEVTNRMEGAANTVLRQHGEFIPLPKFDLPTDMTEQAIPVGETYTSGVAKGVMMPGPRQELKLAVEATMADAVEWGKLALHAESPSKLTMKLGAGFTEGFALGIEGGISRATTAAQHLAQSAADAAHGVMNDAGTLSFGNLSPSAFVGRAGRSGTASTTSATPGVVVPPSNGPTVGSMTIVEAQNPRLTAHRVINELRTLQLLTGRGR